MKENGVLAGIWKDSKEVPFLSSNCPPVAIPPLLCSRRIDNHVAQIAIPPAIKYYNQNKSGVDQADQSRQYCHLRIKQLRRWWIPLFFFMLDTTIENARIAFNWGKSKKERLPTKIFRLDLIAHLAPEKSEKVLFLFDLLERIKFLTSQS